jgi:Tfp pilus assembly protein PilO
MSRLTKEKRNQLVLVSLLGLGLLAGFWFGVIRFQQEAIQNLDVRKKTAESKVKQVREANKNSDEIETQLAEVGKMLEIQEEDMAPEDNWYAWVVDSIRKFKLRYKVDIPQYVPGAAAEMNLLPKFPYKQVTVTVSGTAHYHDLGKFVADFENQFPNSRILNLDLQPASESGSDEREKLHFKMDIVSLIKSGPSRLANTP